MIPRHLTPHLERAARHSPVITLTGPRQAGKTTLVRAVFPGHRYLSLENPDVRQEARTDPRGFLAQSDRLILDEIQRVPDVLSYLQGIVDEDPRPGRFVVTGSQNLLVMRSVSQTLAGRSALLELHPFSVAELRGAPPLDPSSLDRLPDQAPEDDWPFPFPAEDPWNALVVGFFPPVRTDRPDWREWLGDYLRTWFDRDLTEILRVTDLGSFENFVRLAAARTATEINLTGLGNDCGISAQTARRWLGALETSHLATRLRPHFKNYGKRLRKRPRLHFLDSGLVCYLLGIPDATTLARHPLRGPIFESFVVSELVKAFSVRREEARLHFWRDTSGNEVDVLLDFGDRLLPVEIRSGRTVLPESARGLRRWTALPGNPNRGGVLVHGGDREFSLRGCRVAPWFLAHGRPR